MRRVLIVSPRFPPVNAADMHRVRLSLPYFREFGWEPTVLAVDPDECDAPCDPLLVHTIPKQVRVIRTSAFSRKAAARIGLGSFDLRALPYLAAAGRRLLARERFDLVYFSTTAFSTAALGRLWLHRFDVPYVLDMQDPWRNDYYRRPNTPAPPGGRIKYAMSSALARLLEPLTMRRVSHVITVSPAYPHMLQARYGWMRPEQFTVLPFGASDIDYELLHREGVRQEVFDPADGREHWVYAGVAPPMMAFALRGFFMALARARLHEPARFGRLRLHFIGTSYAPAEQARKIVEPLADACGVGDLVHEIPARVPYFQVLRCLLDAHALIVPGSDDPGYTASKLYPYILARKPLLTIFHERSSVAEVMRATGAGVLATFADGDSPDALAREIERLWFAQKQAPPRTDWRAFERYTAREMTRRQCEVFDCVVGNRDPTSDALLGAFPHPG